MVTSCLGKSPMPGSNHPKVLSACAMLTSRTISQSKAELQALLCLCCIEYLYALLSLTEITPSLTILVPYQTLMPPHLPHSSHPKPYCALTLCWTLAHLIAAIPSLVVIPYQTMPSPHLPNSSPYTPASLFESPLGAATSCQLLY